MMPIDDMEYETFLGNVPMHVNNNSHQFNWAIIIFVIAIGSFIFLIISIIGLFCCYRILCSRTTCSTDDAIIETSPIVERPLTPRPESFRRNSAQAHFRLLLQNKYEQEFGSNQKWQPAWYPNNIPEGEIV